LRVREGSSIGAYRVLRKIGEGGMGAVFLAEHTLLGRHAAIKVLLPELSSKRTSIDRFFNEARATTSISDPGIVQVFDFGFTADNVAYIVMELLEGEQLHQRIQRLGALPLGDALRITRQVAGSLGAAHAAGIIHRDLKPENLYMIRDPEAPGGERAKILDFGIAKLDDEMPDRMRTRTGAVLGTPVYMSPEQCSGAGQLDHRADIYALGCVLFHLLTGQPPFDLLGVGAIISAHMREPAPAPSSIAGPLPPGVDELVLRCLAKAPDDRFAAMLDLQRACDEILASLPPVGPVSVMMRAELPRVSRPSYEPPATRPAPETPGTWPSQEPPRTTLETSAGQSSVTVARRRVGLWVALAALAGGSGAAIAVLTSRPGAHRVVAGQAPVEAVVVPDAAVAPDAIVAPIAQAADAIDASTADAGAVAPDAGVASGSEAASAGSASRHAAEPVHKPGPAKPAAKPQPTRRSSEDLYDDRN
jgi:serine/threonine-protein kinase